MKFTRPVAFLCCALMSGCATVDIDPFGDDDMDDLRSEKGKGAWYSELLLPAACVVAVGSLLAYGGIKEERAARRSAKKRKKGSPSPVVTTQKIAKPDVWKKYPGMDQMETKPTLNGKKL